MTMIRSAEIFVVIEAEFAETSPATFCSTNMLALTKTSAPSTCRSPILRAISGAVLIAIIVPSSAYLVSMFKPEMPEIGDIAVKALHIYTYSVIGFGVCMTIQGAFIGLGKTKVPLMLGVLRIWLLRYIFILATERFLSYYSIYWGNLFSNITAGLVSVILILNTKWVSGIKK